MAKNKKEKSPVKTKSDSGKKTTALPQYGLAEDILVLDSTSSKEDSKTIESEKDENVKEQLPEEEDSIEKSIPEDETSEKFVTFFLKNEEYALPISRVQEINRVGDITRVPNSAKHVMGVINVRGKIIPVIDAKYRLDLGKTAIDDQSRIVMVEFGARVLGLMVDKVSHVLDIFLNQIEDPPEEVDKADWTYISGIGQVDEKLIIFLDIDKLINGKSHTTENMANMNKQNSN